MNLKFPFYRQMLSVFEIFGQKDDTEREGWGLGRSHNDFREKT
jgi:hypothetical protein